MKLGQSSLQRFSQGSHDRMSILECLFWGVPCRGIHTGVPVLECPRQESLARMPFLGCLVLGYPLWDTQGGVTVPGCPSLW